MDWIEGIKHGICRPLHPIHTDIIQQAVINLGGGKFVNQDKPTSWWIKDYWELTTWERRLTRLRILIKVGGYGKLRKEALRVEEKLNTLPLNCPELEPNRYLCPQFKSIPVTSIQLRDILLSMGCPNVSALDDKLWVTGGTLFSSEGIKARKEIIQFMRINWNTLRLRLCAY